MKRNKTYLLLTALAICTSCVDPQAIDEESEGADVLHLLRIDLEEHEGVLRQTGLSPVEVHKDFAPIRPPTGEYIAVAMDGETVVDSTWFSLPRWSSEHGDDGEGEIYDYEIKTPASTISFVADAAISEIKVFDSQDEMILSFDPNVFVASRETDERPEHIVAFETAHPNVKLWIPADDLPAHRRASRTVETPSEEQVTKLTTAFDALPPTLQKSITGLVVAQWAGRSRTAGGQTFGFVVMFKSSVLDANEQDTVSARMHHEAVHAFTNLLDGRAGKTSELAAGYLAEARSEIPVIGDFHKMWCVLANVALSAGVTKKYRTSKNQPALCQYDAEEVLGDTRAQESGFANGYGQSKPREDMGDFAAKTEWGPARGGFPAQCTTLATGDIEAEVLAYAKIRLLASYGMITTTAAANCLGASLDPPTQEGLHLDGTSYTNDLRAGQITEKDSELLRAAIIGDSDAGAVSFVSTPDLARGGAFRIASDGAADAHSVNDRASLRIEDNGDETAYTEGIIFVDSYAGSNFGGRIILAGVNRNKRTHKKASIILSGEFSSSAFESEVEPE